MWTDIDQRRGIVHDALISGDRTLPQLLLNPRLTMLYYGVEDIYDHEPRDETHRESRANHYAAMMVSLAYALGLARMPNPEGGTEYPRETPPPVPPVETILTALDARTGVRIRFPNPFPDEDGLATSRGIAGMKAISAIYQACQLSQAARLRDAQVLEIGAGIGKTAYYARQFGLTRYTVVDLPLSLVGQAVYLALAIDEQAVRFGSEPEQPGKIELLSPAQFDADPRRFALVLNADSMPEMDRAHVLSYIDRMRRDGAYFISINHEANAHTVHELLPAAARISRAPYLLRPGYLEERYEFRTR
jgi:hypothetical protein